MKYKILLLYLLLVKTSINALYLSKPNASTYQPILHYDFYTHKEYPLRFCYDDYELENNRENYQVDGNDIGLINEIQFINVYNNIILDKDKHGDPFWAIQYHYYYARDCQQCIFGYVQKHEHDWEWTYVVVVEDRQGYTPFLATGSGHDENNHVDYHNGEYGWFYDNYRNAYSPLQASKPNWGLLNHNEKQVIWYIANTGNEFLPNISGSSIEMPYIIDTSDIINYPNYFCYGDPLNHYIGLCGTDEFGAKKKAPWMRNHWNDPFPDDIDVPDCIPPVVLQVEVTQNGKTCYWGRWTETPKFINGIRLVESRKWEEMPEEERDTVLLGQALKVRVAFSEKMKEYKKPIYVNFGKASPFGANKVIGDWIADNIWEGEYHYPAVYDSNDYQGKNTLSIYAQDKEGNLLDGRPGTVVAVNNTGRINYEDEDGQNGFSKNK